MILTFQSVKKLSNIPLKKDNFNGNQTIEGFMGFYQKTYLEYSKQRNRKEHAFKCTDEKNIIKYLKKIIS